MKIRHQHQNWANHHLCCPTASYVSKWLKQPTEQWENSPRKRPNLDPVGQGSLTGLVHTMGQRGSHALAHPSSTARNRQGSAHSCGNRHISQALTSVTREETSSPDGNLQMTTETKHEPESTWCACCTNSPEKTVTLETQPRQLHFYLHFNRDEPCVGSFQLPSCPTSLYT